MKSKLTIYPGDKKKYQWRTKAMMKEFEYSWDIMVEDNLNSVEPYLKAEEYNDNVQDELYGVIDLNKNSNSGTYADKYTIGKDEKLIDITTDVIDFSKLIKEINEEDKLRRYIASGKQVYPHDYIVGRPEWNYKLGHSIVNWDSIKVTDKDNNIKYVNIKNNWENVYGNPIILEHSNFPYSHILTKSGKFIINDNKELSVGDYIFGYNFLFSCEVGEQFPKIDIDQYGTVSLDKDGRVDHRYNENFILRTSQGKDPVNHNWHDGTSTSIDDSIGDERGCLGLRTYYIPTFRIYSVEPEVNTFKADFYLIEVEPVDANAPLIQGNQFIANLFMRRIVDYKDKNNTIENVNMEVNYVKDLHSIGNKLAFTEELRDKLRFKYALTDKGAMAESYKVFSPKYFEEDAEYQIEDRVHDTGDKLIYEGCYTVSAENTLPMSWPFAAKDDKSGKTLIAFTNLDDYEPSLHKNNVIYDEYDRLICNNFFIDKQIGVSLPIIEMDNGGIGYYTTNPEILGPENAIYGIGNPELIIGAPSVSIHNGRAQFLSCAKFHQGRDIEGIHKYGFPIYKGKDYNWDWEEALLPAYNEDTHSYQIDLNIDVFKEKGDEYPSLKMDTVSFGQPHLFTNFPQDEMRGLPTLRTNGLSPREMEHYLNNGDVADKGMINLKHAYWPEVFENYPNVGKAGFYDSAILPNDYVGPILEKSFSLTPTYFDIEEFNLSYNDYSSTTRGTTRRVNEDYINSLNVKSLGINLGINNPDGDIYVWMKNYSKWPGPKDRFILSNVKHIGDSIQIGEDIYFYISLNDFLIKFNRHNIEQGAYEDTGLGKYHDYNYKVTLPVLVANILNGNSYKDKYLFKYNDWIDNHHSLPMDMEVICKEKLGDRKDLILLKPQLSLLADVEDEVLRLGADNKVQELTLIDRDTHVKRYPQRFLPTDNSHYSWLSYNTGNHFIGEGWNAVTSPLSYINDANSSDRNMWGRMYNNDIPTVYANEGLYVKVSSIGEGKTWDNQITDTNGDVIIEKGIDYSALWARDFTPYMGVIRNEQGLFVNSTDRHAYPDNGLIGRVLYVLAPERTKFLRYYDNNDDSDKLVNVELFEDRYTYPQERVDFCDRSLEGKTIGTLTSTNEESIPDASYREYRGLYVGEAIPPFISAAPNISPSLILTTPVYEKQVNTNSTLKYGTVSSASIGFEMDLPVEEAREYKNKYLILWYDYKNNNVWQRQGFFYIDEVIAIDENTSRLVGHDEVYKLNTYVDELLNGMKGEGTLQGYYQAILDYCNCQYDAHFILPNGNYVLDNNYKTSKLSGINAIHYAAQIAPGFIHANIDGDIVLDRYKGNNVALNISDYSNIIYSPAVSDILDKVKITMNEKIIAEDSGQGKKPYFIADTPLITSKTEVSVLNNLADTIKAAYNSLPPYRPGSISLLVNDKDIQVGDIVQLVTPRGSKYNIIVMGMNIDATGVTLTSLGEEKYPVESNAGSAQFINISNALNGLDSDLTTTNEVLMGVSKDVENIKTNYATNESVDTEVQELNKTIDNKNYDASHITTGVLHEDRIPNIKTSKIEGKLSDNQLPASVVQSATGGDFITLNIDATNDITIEAQGDEIIFTITIGGQVYTGKLASIQ